MTKIFTLEELQRFQEQGTLEQHILSNGLLPMDVLKGALEDVSLTTQALGKEIEKLEEGLDWICW